MTMMRNHGAPSAMRTGHDGDDAMLEAIALRGEEHTMLRWQHHLYLPDEASADTVGNVAARAGWEIVRLEAMPAPYSGWMLRLARYDVLEPDLVSATRSFLDDVARSHRGHYDGWDALDALPRQTHSTIGRPPRRRPRRTFARRTPAAV